MGYLYVRGVGCEDPVVIYIYIPEFELMGGGGGGGGGGGASHVIPLRMGHGVSVVKIPQ